jgi:hypothetical protein
MEENPTEDNNTQNQPPQNNDESSSSGVSLQPDIQPIANLNETPPLNAPPIVTPIDPDVMKPVASSPGLIILQWLTYAFWFWTVIAMSYLTVTVLAHYISGADVGDSTLYSIAAVVVLLPISVICDIFYIKREPEKKTGAASIVMIIHAVIFALAGIGALVTAVFSVVTLYISNSGSENTLVTLYSALIIAFLFAVIFLRTILPKKLFKMRPYFIILMVVIVGVIVTFGVIGPVAEARATRNDKLIEANLGDVSTSIDNYVTKNKQLPKGLDNIELTGDTKKLVTDNLVTYKNDGKSSEQTDSTTMTGTYRYQLCVTYTKASKNDNGAVFNPATVNSDGYSDYISYTSHTAGYTCYKLETTTTTTTTYSDTFMQ